MVWMTNDCRWVGTGQAKIREGVEMLKAVGGGGRSRALRVGVELERAAGESSEWEEIAFNVVR
ncbi:hypothetical protein GYMLUDRAFT_839827 [Collybiopsis luxurians FD-317 M1]|uniref:Laminin IV type B domain-containing protein n=1 Tax=Collybiopsis luxurians FD-317 M1 TaxID=944289 RepID=A0A0D0CK41_9AGAR|nr:hypothetical protein GYMLUDRAFT_839827 [Collybiopsis luxurians FD-317 M1]